MEIQTRFDSKRGCGYRKVGGTYLMGPAPQAACCKLPFALTVCPTCHAGIKPTRGWTWVDAAVLFATQPCADPGCGCPLDDCGRLTSTGLLWVGGAFYKTADEFLLEAQRLGVSRRIPAVPRGFVLGETWVLLAHRKLCPLPQPDGSTLLKPGVFSAFKPTAVEYVVRGDETKEELETKVKRGITPVKVQIADRLPMKRDDAL